MTDGTDDPGKVVSLAEHQHQKLVFLGYRSPLATAETMVAFSCSNCRNKTFVLIEDERSKFPVLRCSCCTQTLGRIGWVHDEG